MTSGYNSFFNKVKLKVQSVFKDNKVNNEPYDFNKSNPLGGNGERVDIQINDSLNFESLDVYQKNHYRRYQFAKEFIKEGDVCGDFACGTGYGSVMLADKAARVMGADINGEVIKKIKLRYKALNNVEFIEKNILELDLNAEFDNVISFETLEHFEEDNIRKLLAIFNKAIKKGGQLIFSTPYMQEKSEEAMKMGFHFTFYINEEKIRDWCVNAGFTAEEIKYQNYETHTIESQLENKDFIICRARKN